jgi:hypothetical protein
VADANDKRCDREHALLWAEESGRLAREASEIARRGNSVGRNGATGPTAEASPFDPWANLVWLPCSDGKARPVKPGILPLSDGLQSHLANVRAIEAQAMTEIESYGAQNETDPGEVMRMVRDFVRSETPDFWKAGGCWGFQPAPVLLNFLLNLEAARNGTADSGGWTKARAEAHERTMQCLRLNSGNLCPSYRWEPEEQQARKPASSVRALSLVLARYAQAHGQATIDAHAALNRVGILRGAGNAIVPQVAAEFVAACVDVLP